MTTVLLGVALLGLAPAPQDPDLKALDREVRFSIDDEGRVLISPDPFRGDGTGSAPVVERGLDAFQNAGSLGYAMLAFPGATDFASLCDADAFFRRLGIAEDSELLQRILRRAEPDDHPSVALLRLLAVRAAQVRGLKPALGPLARLLDDETVGGSLRTAAVEATAALGGARPTGTVAELAPLAGRLAEIPRRADAVFCVDQRALPPARPLARWAEAVMFAATKAHMRADPARASAAEWLRIRQLGSSVGILPYDLARRFGNFRIDRTILALRIQDGPRAAPRVWVSLEGEFDLSRLRAGLSDERLEVEDRQGGGFDVALPWGTLTCSARRARFVMPGFEEPLDEKGSKELAAAFADDAPIHAHVRGDVSLPDSMHLPDDLLIRDASVWIPRTTAGAIAMRATFRSPATATLVETQLGGLARLVEIHAARYPAFEPVADLLEGIEVEADGATVIARLPLGGVDAGELLFDAVLSQFE